MKATNFRQLLLLPVAIIGAGGLTSVAAQEVEMEIDLSLWFAAGNETDDGGTRRLQDDVVEEPAVLTEEEIATLNAAFDVAWDATISSLGIDLSGYDVHEYDNYVVAGGNRLLEGAEEGQGDDRQLAIGLCKKCKNANNFQKCLKNKCGSKKRRRLTVQDVRNVARRIQASRGNVRGRSSAGGQRGSASPTAKQVEKEIEEEIETEYDIALVKETLNDKVAPTTGRLSPKVAFDLFQLEDVSQNECSPREFLGECDTAATCGSLRTRNGKVKYPDATECVAALYGGVCMCGAGGDQPCGCRYKSTTTGNAAAANSNAGRTCNARDYQNECMRTDHCKQKYRGAYDCKLTQGGVCYCGVGRVCGCADLL